MPTVRLKLPYIVASQAQKEVTHNTALNMIDVLVDAFVLHRNGNDPPASFADGDAYITGSAPTGAWAGHAYKIASALDGAWSFYDPVAGLRAYVKDEALTTIWNGTAWADDVPPAPSTQNLAGVGIGTSYDATNKLAVKSGAVLLSYDDSTGGTGDMRATLNKEAAANDAGFVFQDGASTRALFGLLGDDNFTVKVSADGSTFHTALTVDATSGQPKLPIAPKFAATTNFDNYIAADTWTKVQFNAADSNDQSAFDAGTATFTAPFAGVYALGFSMRFRANATVPTKVIAAFYKGATELGRGRAVSGPPVDDVTTYNLAILAPLAAADAIDVRVNLATNDGYIKADQSAFWGFYIP